jgi:hypothetical protein
MPAVDVENTLMRKHTSSVRRMLCKHSSDAAASVEGDSLDTELRSENSDMTATASQQVLREPSVGIIPIPVRYRVGFSTALVPQQQL